MPSFSRALVFAFALPMIVLTQGCSKDKHVFYSSVMRPATVTLIDTYRSEEVWSMDIPVNHRLSLDFKGNAPGKGGNAAGGSSSVTWKLQAVSDKPTSSGYGKAGKSIDSGTIDLTGKRVGMKTSYRESPEMPDSAGAAPVPTRETSESVAAEAIAESKRAASEAALPPSDEAVQPVEDVVEEVEAVEAEAAEVEAAEVEAAEIEAVEVEAVEVEAVEAPAAQPTK